MNDSDQIKAFNQIFQQINLLRSEVRRNSGYLARQELERLIQQIRSNPNRLEQYGFKVYSQNDEDGILSEIFKRIGISKGVFCEIGVENGLECNSLYLLHQGWRGVWMEGNPQQCQAIEGKFSSLIESKKLALNVGYITPANINKTLEEMCHFLGENVGEIDFLSIDIDGMDIYLFEALKHYPKVICIEYNAKFPPPLNKKPVYQENYRWTGTDYMGSSLVAIERVAKEKGYSLVATNFVGANAFFVQTGLAKEKFDVTLTAKDLYNPSRYYLFYDHYHRGAGHPPDFGLYADLV